MRRLPGRLWALAAILVCAAALRGQPSRVVEMDNGLLKVAFDRGTNLWSLYEFEANDWQPVIVGAGAVLRLRGGDTLAFRLTRSDAGAKITASDDPIGKGRRLDLHAADDRADWTVRLTLYNERKLLRVDASIVNVSVAPWATWEFSLVDLHGASHLQHATDSVLLRLDAYGSLDGVQSVLLDSAPVTGFWSALFVEPLAWRSVLFGFLANAQAVNAFRADGLDRSTGAQQFATSADLSTASVAPGGALVSDPLLVSFDRSPIDNMRRFAGLQQAFAPAANKPFTPTGRVPASLLGGASVPSVLRTGERFGTRATEDSIVSVLAPAVRRLRRAGLRVVELGDGFELAPGDWTTNRKFPRGHRWLTDRIHAAGFAAGVRIAPFAVGEGSALARKHPEWLLRDTRDSLEVFFEREAWGGRVYGLDPTIPAVQAWLQTLLLTATTTWGYDHITLDHLSMAASGTRYSKPVSRAQAYQMGLKAIRRGTGPDKFLLAGGAPIGCSVGFVDGMETSSLVRAASDRAYFHGATWYGAPGVLMLGEPLAASDARSAAAAVALSGQMPLLGDNVAALDQQSVELLGAILPSYGVSADPVGYETPSAALTPGGAPAIWNLPVDRPFGRWNVVGVFNRASEPTLVTLDAERLGLAPRKRYVAYERWSGRYFDALGDTLSLSPGASALLSVREAGPEPFVLFTSRHLTGGAVDLADARWDADKRRLSVAAEGLLSGTYEVVLYVPAGARLARVRASVRHTEVPLGDRAVRVLFEVRGERLAWQADFQ
jgi:alpha-galactosidase